MGIRLGPPVIDGRRVRVPVDVDDGARRLVVDDHWAEYDFDPTEVPVGVLLIPAVAALLPVSWVEDVELFVPTLDEEFWRAASAMRRAWHETYPSIDLGGELVVDTTEAHAPSHRPGGSVSLFSGGLDSMATALDHVDDPVRLCSIWGIDVEADDRIAWRASRDLIDEFARSHGLAVSVIRSNVRRFIDEPLLNRRHGRPMGHWWRGTLGLVLPSIVAPLAWAAGADRILVPATHTEGFALPHGTRPGLDDRVRFFGVEVAHDGFDASRHDKLRSVTTLAPTQHVLVCASGTARGAGNCMRCMKCLRTMVGLTLIGVDPAAHGFDASPESFARIRRMLETGRGFDFNEHEEFYWLDLQAEAESAAPADLPGVEGFFEWLGGVDVAELRSQAAPDGLRRIRRSVGRIVPGRLRPLARRWYLRVFRRW